MQIKTSRFKSHYHNVQSGAGNAAALDVTLTDTPATVPQVCVDNNPLLRDITGANGFTWVTGSRTLHMNASGANYEIQYNYNAQ